MSPRILLPILLVLGFAGAAAGDDLEDREWQHVRDALFMALPDSTYDGDRVTRWVDQPLVLMLGATDDDRAFLAEMANEFNRLLGPVAIRIEDEDEDAANIGILIASSRMFPALANRHGMQASRHPRRRPSWPRISSGERSRLPSCNEFHSMQLGIRSSGLGIERLEGIAVALEDLLAADFQGRRHHAVIDGEGFLRDDEPLDPLDYR